MTTAAEKFDKVPPWCEIKDAPGGHGFWVHHIEREFVCINTTGEWATNDARRYTTQENAIAAARLTSPLDSWEPPADCPLPVEGWSVARFFDAYVIHVADGSYFTRHGLFTGNRLATPAQAFPTRRAAYIWAWKEAPAPTDDVGTTDGIAGRITPEADSQVDGKGRTLVDIDGKIDRECARINELVRGLRADVDHAQHTADTANGRIDDLIAGKVKIAATVNVRSDDASTNELATAEAASDEPKWKCVVVRCDDRNWLVTDSSGKWFLTADGGWDVNDDTKYGLHRSRAKAIAALNSATYPPPTWYAVQLGNAHEAAIAAESRAATAVRRASEAESKLADARASLEQVKRELAETNRLLINALESAETPG